MLNNKTIAVVVPAYNEETQIGIVIDTMPDFVDRIIVVNDCSTDRTAEVVKSYIAKGEKGISIPKANRKIEKTFFNQADIVTYEMFQEEERNMAPFTVVNDNDEDRIVLIEHKRNAKVGGAIATGYLWCRNHNIDCTAVMAGDAQMDPAELQSICSPVIERKIDYVKGNRLSHKSASRLIPRKRRFGNSLLSALTKIASGYWFISDTQTGYTAISLRALQKLELDKIYPTYGVPNDILIKLNIHKCSLCEVPIKPVYAIGEQSKMRIKKVIPSISMLLLKGFVKRIWQKYFITDFHPISLFYFLGAVGFVASLYFFAYILSGLDSHSVSNGTYFGFVTSLLSSFLFNGMAMWMDIIDNDKLQHIHDEEEIH